MNTQALPSKDRRQRGTEARMGALLDAVREAIVTTDADHNVEQFNPAAEKMFGCASAEAKGRPITRFIPHGIPWEEPQGEHSDSVAADSKPTVPPLRTISGLRASGDAFAAEVTVSRLPPNSTHGQVFILVLRDSSLRTRYESEIARLNRLYAALSHINQAIVQSPTREALFPKVCQLLVEHAGFGMAWIGWLDDATQAIQPVAQFGDHTGYLHAIEVFADDRPEGGGLSGKALRERSPFICNDLLEDPSAVPWREAARAQGFRASAAYPILLQGRACAVLNVYAQEPGFFQDKEVALLREAACDIGFALDKFARDEEAQRLNEMARRERAFSDTMIESMPGIVYFYTAAGRFLRWNRDFEAVSGYTGAEIADMHPLDFFAGDDKAEVANRIADVFDTGASSVEAMFLSKDGRLTPYLLTGRRIVFHAEPCLLGMGINITRRHESEAALRDLNESLERKVGERTSELQTALLRAESADRIKSDFLASMSHELRTPLNSILGFSGILLQGMAGPLNAEQAKQLGMVRTSARHLLELINDVLDISKIEAGQLEVRGVPFNMRDSIERVLASVKPMAASKGLALEAALPDDLGSWCTDRRRFEQIMLNLLNNAIKFTEVGTVTLVVRTGPALTGGGASGADTVCVRVSDTGIGIRQADLQTLFQPFRQIDSGLSRKYEGTGLGLAICRRLANLLGGNIEAQSTWGQGSSFELTLPMMEQD